MSKEKTPETLFSERRGHFPSLAKEVAGNPVAYFDGPGGTQVPQSVIEAISAYYRTSNANTHGQFETSRESDEVIDRSRRAIADFLAASGPEQISFGANMTTLTFSLSRAICRSLREGDEILITQLDHEANRGPWLRLRRHGIRVREARMTPGGELDYEDLAAKLGENTRLVAVGWASNAVGTVNDLKKIRRWSQAVGAWMLVDAVHYAPHFPIDVRDVGADFLLCSAYKFYGPHVGILYCRDNLLAQLDTDRLRTQEAEAPFRIETGTLNHAALAGVQAAVDYLTTFGSGHSRREELVGAMSRIQSHEHRLLHRLYQALSEMGHLRLYGPPVRNDLARAPTLAFRVLGLSPQEVARKLGQRGLTAWDGDFYAVRAVEMLGLADSGGLVRVGISLYNTQEDVDRLIEALGDMTH